MKKNEDDDNASFIRLSWGERNDSVEECQAHRKPSVSICFDIYLRDRKRRCFTVCVGVALILTENHLSSNCLITQTAPLGQSVKCMLCSRVNGSDSMIFHSPSWQFSHDSDVALHICSSSEHPQTAPWPDKSVVTESLAVTRVKASGQSEVVPRRPWSPPFFFHPSLPV